MLNALANHGYLPRSGLNISVAMLEAALSGAVNLDPSAAQPPGVLALETSTTGDASTFDLDNLDEHGILEHDGSLSRNDHYFGDDHSFNQAIWDATASHFGESVISIETAALARAARIARAASVNPKFNMTATDIEHSLIETGLYLAIFGNVVTGNAVTEWVRILFEQERIPFAEGFCTSETVITAADINGLVEQVVAATPQ